MSEPTEPTEPKCAKCGMPLARDKDTAELVHAEGDAACNPGFDLFVQTVATASPDETDTPTTQEEAH